MFTEFLTAVAEHAFLQAALAGGLLASIACGLLGSLVVVNRIAFLAGGIAHSVLAGMGAAHYFGFSPLLGALATALAAALLIGWTRLRYAAREDTLVGAFWAVGMAVGLLFISKTPGYSSDLMSYLFGNILLIPAQSLWLMAAIDLVLIALITVFYRPFLAISFDMEHAALRGVPVMAFYLLMLCLVALTVVLVIQVVGLILVIALLTLPAATAGHYVHSLRQMMLLSVLLGSGFTTAGLALSFGPDLPAGPTIIVLAGAVYLLSTVIRAWVLKTRAAKTVNDSLPVNP